MRYYLSIVAILTAGIISGCGGTDEPSTNGARNTGASNNASANGTDPMEGVRRPDAPTANNAPTLAPVVVKFYDALKSKDDDAVRSVLSKEQIASIEADMKEEKRTDMAGFLAEFETLPDSPIQVRNEQISGNKAVAEVLGGTYVNWTPLGFVMEDGKWKLSGDSPDIDRVDSPGN